MNLSIVKPVTRRFAAIVALTVLAVASGTSWNSVSHVGPAGPKVTYGVAGFLTPAGAVALKGDSVDCANPANQAASAHLTGTVDVAITKITSGMTKVNVQNEELDTTMTVANSGNGWHGTLTSATNGLTCANGWSNPEGPTGHGNLRVALCGMGTNGPACTEIYHSLTIVD